MLFEVTKTSLIASNDISPCNEAIKIKLDDIDMCRCKSFEEYDNSCIGKRFGKWTDKGTGHTVEKNGYITRNLGAEETWGIEFNSLKELIEFTYKYDEIILRKSWIDNQTPCLEIYDDYRE
jgi:hypothetical protein